MLCMADKWSYQGRTWQTFSALLGRIKPSLTLKPLSFSRQTGDPAFVILEKALAAPWGAEVAFTHPNCCLVLSGVSFWGSIFSGSAVGFGFRTRSQVFNYTEKALVLIRWQGSFQTWSNKVSGWTDSLPSSHKRAITDLIEENSSHVFKFKTIHLPWMLPWNKKPTFPGFYDHQW